MLSGIILSTMLIGCGSSPSVQPAAESTRIPSDADIIANITPDTGSIGQHDEDILELKHWKYGINNNEPVGSAVSFQLVSEEDMKQIIDRLIEGGYLSGQPEDEKEFSRALRDFQHDKGLTLTGKLDSATLNALLADEDL